MSAVYPLTLLLMQFRNSDDYIQKGKISSPCLLMALSGRRTRKTRNIFTTDIAPELKYCIGLALEIYSTVV